MSSKIKAFLDADVAKLKRIVEEYPEQVSVREVADLMGCFVDSVRTVINTSMLFILPILGAYIIFSAWIEGRLMFLRERRSRGTMSELTAYMTEHIGFFRQIKQMNIITILVFVFSIVRALIIDPSYLLLDECTCNVDVRTE